MKSLWFPTRLTASILSFITSNGRKAMSFSEVLPPSVHTNVTNDISDKTIPASTTYAAISRTLQYLTDRSEQPRPVVHFATYTFPMTRDQIRDTFRVKIRELKQQYSNIDFSDTPPESLAPGKVDRKGNKFVAVIDSISSNPGTLLPWKEMAQICKEEGVWSVIDAAHSIGQEVCCYRCLYLLDPYLNLNFA